MITLRNATEVELARVLDWAAAEGWNPGLDDAPAFFAADPQGFFVAVEDGVPVAAISVVNHDEQFAFLGLYIVQPEFRGKGIGLRLWQHALEHAGSRTVGLDGVAEQQENYAASGFVHAGGTTRYVGELQSVACEGIGLVQPEDIPRLVEAEQSASGCRKNAYLSAWFHETANRKTLLLRNSGPRPAFCTVRKCREGAKIGPLVAEAATDAELLIRHAATVFGGGVMIDVPDASPDLAELCKRLSLTPGFQTARMYRGAYQTGAPSLFAVASLELG